MKDWRYFCPVSERKGTCYHEFYKGEWDNQTLWKPDSILIHDDTLANLELHKIFSAILPEYDPHGITEVNKSQWQAVLDYASQLDTEAKLALTEAAAWAAEVFKTQKVFTILGI